jgi:EAL domain-containing protein (putative c-di-GMP-specific phosphodiesterase class I)
MSIRRGYDNLVRMSNGGGDEASQAVWQVLDERAIFPLYQPIVELATGLLVAVEALARGPAGSVVETPDRLFAAAARAGCLPEVDMLCGARALEVARDAPDGVPPLVFVNAEPAAFARPLTPDLVKVISDDLPYRIVLEFTERALGAYPPGLLKIANMVHRFGNALALDDVGADPLSLAFLPLIEPEVVKLDMHIVRRPDAAASIDTAAVVTAYAERTGAVVVAEGLESEGDVRNALALGAQWGQGWFWGRPGPLRALAGRPVHPDAKLRPARQDLHVPTGTPFTYAAAHQPVRTGDRRLFDQFVERLMRMAGTAGVHAVVLGATADPAVSTGWLPRLASIADEAAFVGVAGPAPAVPADTRVHFAATSPDIHDRQETTLAVIGPNFTSALCAEPGDSPNSVRFVLTHDADLAHMIGRMLLHRLDEAAVRLAAPSDVQAPRHP